MEVPNGLLIELSFQEKRTFFRDITERDGHWIMRKDPTKLRFRFRGAWQYAHRMFYILLIGELAPGQTVRKACPVEFCANPACNKVVQRRENMKQSIDRMDFDETTVRQVVDDGYHMPLIGADRLEAIQRMIDRRVDDSVIAARIGVNESYIGVLVSRYSLKRQPRQADWVRKYTRQSRVDPLSCLQAVRLM